MEGRLSSPVIRTKGVQTKDGWLDHKVAAGCMGTLFWTLGCKSASEWETCLLHCFLCNLKVCLIEVFSGFLLFSPCLFKIKRILSVYMMDDIFSITLRPQNLRVRADFLNAGLNIPSC